MPGHEVIEIIDTKPNGGGGGRRRSAATAMVNPVVVETEAEAEAESLGHLKKKSSMMTLEMPYVRAFCVTRRALWPLVYVWRDAAGVNGTRSDWSCRRMWLSSSKSVMHECKK